ncbi:MAG: efflux RND transporter periplasmic adaptor subunit [Desulfobacteraceae bacterium]|jgi:Cu(I)/Ag(I) efflux system membrane fusion protein/cobalt-zinc-cadmium efflux system membrane fusion protein
MTRLIIIIVTLLIVSALIGIGGWLAHERSRSQISVATAKEDGVAEKGLKSGMIHPKTGKKIKYWAAPMDPTYIRNEPGKSPMGMDLVPVYEEEGEEKQPASVIRIDPVTIQNMGVRMARVKRKQLVKTIRTYGDITYDETRVKVVSAWVGGRIDKLYVDFTGINVKKGDPLAEIYSPELVTTQQELILALETRGRIWSLGNQEALQMSTDLVNATKQRLLLWGITEEQIREIERTRKVTTRMTLHAPIGGTVIDKQAFEGQYVKEGERLYKIADLSKVWVDVDIYEYELPWVYQGMPAQMELPYIPGRRFKGRVLYVYPYLEEKTRTAKLRLEFQNPDEHLKPGMYANVYLSPTLAKSSLVVPQEAVINTGVRNLVFISRGEGKFEAREVETGLEGNENELQVLKGLREGEEIVVSAQFLLDSESRLREAIRKMLEPAQEAGEIKTEGSGVKERPKVPGAHQH